LGKYVGKMPKVKAENRALAKNAPKRIKNTLFAIYIPKGSILYQLGPSNTKYRKLILGDRR
jgi:hypothetical protein